MRFGIREICDVVLRAKSYQTLGNRKFYKNEPVLYFDTLRTSTLEGAATTVYAQGGRGYTRLIAWEGERTLTFTMEDALLSPESFSILSGAGLLDASTSAPIYVHQTSQVEVEADNTIILPDKACWNGLENTDEMYHRSADIFVMVLGDDGQVNAEPCIPVNVEYTDDETTLTCYSHAGVLPAGSIVLVDYYVKRTGGAQMIEITADKFGGNYYLEASTLFRRESDGVDMPAEFIIPNCKVQSNFTFSMAANGDPSTFTFTMDAFPDYTKFDQTHKVLAAIQVITDESGETEGTREPCQAQTIESYESEAATDVTARLVSNSESAATIEVNGSVSGQAYDTAAFGTEVPKGVQINLTVPVEADGTYKLVSKNPAYANYWKEDPRIQDGVKTSEVTGADLSPMNIILTPESAAGDNITVEVTGIGNTFHKLYTIVNKANFVEGTSASTYSTRSTKTVSVTEDDHI